MLNCLSVTYYIKLFRMLGDLTVLSVVFSGTGPSLKAKHTHTKKGGHIVSTPLGQYYLCVVIRVP